ncbi:MAG: hypothetical protein EXS05_22940 [Planctomycetaceae bacterium]|nr:hypothetical protein [Planctomycetaceae bacterium]
MNNSPPRPGSDRLFELILAGAGQLGLLFAATIAIGLWVLVKNGAAFSGGGVALSSSVFARLNSLGAISLPGYLGDMPGYGLNFHHSEISDEDLALIQQLDPPNFVSMIDLNHTQVTDRGLTQLVLDDTKVTGDCAEYLRPFRRLKFLSLKNTRIDDRVLEAIRGLENLNALYLDGTDITDASLEHLETFPKLLCLGLSGTKITDEGMAALAKIPRLEILGLSNTNIGDAGVANLKGLKSIVQITLIGTQVSETGIGQLKEWKPRSSFIR